MALTNIQIKNADPDETDSPFQMGQDYSLS